ncbi:proton pump-interactor BIP131-like, partial [Fagus crenata]
MEELETNVTQIRPVIENANNVHLHINRIGKESQGPELDEPIKNVTKQVHRFYFVKLMPSNLEARIEEAEKLNEKLKQDIFQISSELKQRMADRDCVLYKLHDLNSKECRIREIVAGKRNELDLLQHTLDKLCFANNAYQGRAIKSCSSQGELDTHKLHFRMQHGRNSLAEEKQLLKEIKASQQKSINSSCVSLDDLNHAMFWYHYDPRWLFNKKVEDKERIIRERNQLICLQEKAIANAVVKGKLWNSFGSKQAIHDKVKLKVTELDGLRKEVLPLRANIKKVEKELHTIKNDVKSLQKQLKVTQDRKGEVHNCISQLKNIHDQENVRTLAQKKDLAALEELSRGQ